MITASDEDPEIVEPDVSAAYEELPPDARLVVAAVVKKAFGLAIGTVSALWLAGIAAIGASTGAERGPVTFTWLVGNSYLPGYAPTWTGVLAGLAWGFVGGFALGFSLALARNRLIKFMFWLDAIRVRLSANRTVLDDLS